MTTGREEPLELRLSRTCERVIVDVFGSPPGSVRCFGDSGDGHEYSGSVGRFWRRFNACL